MPATDMIGTGTTNAFLALCPSSSGLKIALPTHADCGTYVSSHFISTVQSLLFDRVAIPDEASMHARDTIYYVHTSAT